MQRGFAPKASRPEAAAAPRRALRTKPDGETIRERIARIHTSLTQIDYSPGRYIALEAQPTPDAGIRDFQTELRSCRERSLTGSDDAQYSEAKVLQVRQIIERLRGREGLSEQDRRWTAKVTDVRYWSVFAASERWREEHSAHCGSITSTKPWR